MAEKKGKTNSDKLKELQAMMLKLKTELGNVNQQIAQAINFASQTWKDVKFDDFQKTYKGYQAGITKFENNLDNVVKVTLPPLIQAAEDYEKTDVHG